MKPQVNDETKVAEQIVSVLPAGSVVRACADDRGAIRFAVRTASAKLRAIVLSKASLRKLILDPLREVKIEYLQRDILRSLKRRAEYRYPHADSLSPEQVRRAVAVGS